MSLSPGTRLGPYEITAAVGAGAMGEVFRARDTNLNREVAIKVLPEVFAQDNERLVRFIREAQTLASLNHPNIATIYDIEEVPSPSGTGPGSRALVMELVEGEDLAERMARGPIPIGEALPIARQLAEGLEAAHDQGIVHRDLKPANVRLRPDGVVKVLDFGLAKVTAKSSGSGPIASPSGRGDGGTSVGMIIGTVGYMSPEQARGKPVDRRSDIWAFGVVLYEMLSGRRAFGQGDPAETLASVLTSTLSYEPLPAGTPRGLKWLISRCLDRDLRTRLRDIGEARVTIARIENGGRESGASVLGTLAEIVPPSRRAWPWVALFALTLAVLALALIPWRRPPVPTPHKLLANIGADASLSLELGASAILSPDGATLAFVARQAGQTLLFVRGLGQLRAAPLTGTEGASGPFFSPDGEWIAFFAGGRLKKVPVSGGAPIALADAPTGRGGAWTDDETIIFMPTNTSNSSLMTVSAAGGSPSVFEIKDEGLNMRRWPQALPGGKGLLYTMHSTSARFDAASLVVAPLLGGTPKVVVRGGYYGRYAPSGHLVYMQQGTLFAAPFDLGRLETTGPAVAALDDVAADPATGGAQLAMSSGGAMVYLQGAAAAATNPIDWMTSEGRTSVLRATRAEWANPRFSPNGRKLALNISDGKQHDIWVYEWARDTLTQLTFDPSDDRNPVWTADGLRVVFSSDRAKPGLSNLYSVDADGTGEATRLTDSPEDHAGGSWHLGGRLLAYHTNRRAGSWDLMVLPMEDDAGQSLSPGKPSVFLSTTANEMYPMFSPDGRWIAYASDEAGGNFDVYVRPYPKGGGKWRISTGGGNFPRWEANAPRLVFLNQGKVMFAPYLVNRDSFHADAPRIWSPLGYRGLSIGYPYDLHPDGKRVAIIAAPEQSGGGLLDQAVFFFGFGEYLKRIAPGSR